MPDHDPYAADSGADPEKVSAAAGPTPAEAVHEAEVHTSNGGVDAPGQTVPATPVPEEQAAKSTSGVPQGTSKEVAAWVGDDKDRANTALAEEKKSEQPRKGLISDLEAVIKA